MAGSPGFLLLGAASKKNAAGKGKEPAAGSPRTGLSQESARAPSLCRERRGDSPVGFFGSWAEPVPSSGQRGRLVAYRARGCALPVKAEEREARRK